MKAMILAAGRGERMRPLTEQTPKPLLEVGGRPLISYVFDQCKSAGVTDIVMNVWYKADIIMDTLGDGRDYGVNITYSVEDELLGTAGGVINALPLLSNQPFFMISGDIWSGYHLKYLIDRKDSLKLAHLVLVSNPSFHPDGDYHLNAMNHVCVNGEPKLTYGSIALFHPDLFVGFKPGKRGIDEVFRAAIEKNQITGEHFQGPWMNIGTPAQLQQLDERLRRTA